MVRTILLVTTFPAVLLDSSLAQGVAATAPERLLAGATLGAAATDVVETTDPRDVSILGVVEIATSLEQFVDFVRNVDSIAIRGTTRSYGRLRPEHLRDDLTPLSLPHRDLSPLRRCEVADCKVKLSTELIDQMQGLDGNSSTFSKEVDAVMRTWLANYVHTYLTFGDSALVVYVDQEEPAHPLEGMRYLLESADEFMPIPAELSKSLSRSAPSLASPHVQSSLYWAVEGTPLRPMTQVSELLVLPPSADRPEVWIAFKQLYASHYLLAALKVIRVTEVQRGANPRIRVTFLDRSLFDGPLGGVKRAIVELGLDAELESRLTQLRERVTAASSGSTATSP